MIFGRQKYYLLIAIILLTAISAKAQDHGVPVTESEQPLTAGELLKWHETFIYEVRYSFFKLGKIKVEVVSDTLYDNQQSWHMRSVIISNSGIPFMGKEENHYNSIFSINDDTFEAQKFWMDNVDEEEYNSLEYIFDRQQKKVYAYEIDQPRDTLALEEPASSGHIFFLAGRLTAGTDSVFKKPIYRNLEKKYMTITNTTKTEMRKYDAFPEKVETFYSKGETDVDGPFGFSGKFESWHLTDNLRVPVEARVKVWLGKAKIRLIDYKKELRK